MFITGIGRKKIVKSMTMLKMALMCQNNVKLMHVPSAFRSHTFDIGRHSSIVAIVVATVCRTITTKRTPHTFWNLKRLVLNIFRYSSSTDSFIVLIVHL